MKILALVALIATSCGFNQIDKKEKSNRSQSNCVDKCFNQDAQAFGNGNETSEENPSIDASGLLANEANVKLVTDLYEENKAEIKRQAEAFGLSGITTADMDAVFAELMAAGKVAQSKDLDSLIDEMEPVVIASLESKESIKPNMDKIEENRVQAKLLIKLLAPNIIKNGLDSLSVDDILSNVSQ